MNQEKKLKRNPVIEKFLNKILYFFFFLLFFLFIVFFDEKTYSCLWSSYMLIVLAFLFFVTFLLFFWKIFPPPFFFFSFFPNILLFFGKVGFCMKKVALWGLMVLAQDPLPESPETQCKPGFITFHLEKNYFPKKERSYCQT